MRIKLEFEDYPVFATLSNSAGDVRILTVEINGRPFRTWAQVAPVFLRPSDPGYIEEVDRMLVKAMERMFEKVFTNACAALPEGQDLLTEDR